MAKKDKINLKIGKLLYKLNFCNKSGQYNVDINRKTNGFDRVGRNFIKEFLVNKNMTWLQEMMKLWEDTI